MTSLGFRDPCQVPQEVGVQVPEGRGIPLGCSHGQQMASPGLNTV